MPNKVTHSDSESTPKAAIQRPPWPDTLILAPGNNAHTS
jgi:hypothetical protein